MFPASDANYLSADHFATAGEWHDHIFYTYHSDPGTRTLKELADRVSLDYSYVRRLHSAWLKDRMDRAR